MRKKYDLIVGIGNACSCTQTLRAAGLQYLSFPFDWIIMASDDDLAQRIDIIASEFKGWFEQKDLIKVGSYPAGDRDIYRNTATNTIFNHEFRIGEDIGKSFAAVRAKYDRRIARFLELLRSSGHVLLVRMDRPDQAVPTSIESCRNALHRIRKLFPSSQFDMICLTMEKDIDFASRKVFDLGDGLIHIAFDYGDSRPGGHTFDVKIDQTAKAISLLGAVKDYRTNEEKKSFADSKRRNGWAKYGASTFGEYLRIRLGLCARKKYGLIIGFGNACSCSQALRHAGLQHLSFPFDWIVYNTESGDLRDRADLVCNNFANFLNLEDLSFRANGSPQHSTDIYYNNRTKIIHHHDFPKDIPLSESFNYAKEKYQRRISRTYDLINSAKSVLIVRLDRPDQKIPTSTEDCQYLRKRLSERFPGVSFDIIVFHLDPSTPLCRAKPKTVCEGVSVVAFDYRSSSGDMPTNISNGPSRYLRSHYKVRDYRSLTERMQHLIASIRTKCH